MPIDRAQTFPQLLDQVADRHGNRVFLRRKTSRDAESVTFAELRSAARELAAGLAAHGIGRGDHVGLVSENRYEWLLADLACSHIGAADVPRGTDTAITEVAFILQHSGCRFAFVETDPVARELLDRRDELPALERVCVLSDRTEVEGATTLAAMREAAAEWSRDHDVAELGAAVEPADLLTIVYTSGTTAEPKGVMLTHANVVRNLEMIRAVLDFDERDDFLSVLPAWHVYERIMDYVALASGSSLTYSDRRRLKDDLREVRPTAFAGVPRIWENIHDGIVNHCLKQKGLRRRLLAAVLDSCRHVGGGTAGPVRRAVHKLYAKAILPKFLAATGGRLRIAASGGGSLPAHVDRCLLGMGLPLLNGYGLTETSPVVCIRSPKDNRAGTIGPPVPDTELEIRNEQGEPVPLGEIGLLWIRGPQVMRGYYNNDERTKLVIDADGWFNSGDLARIDRDGHVTITGRAKDTIVLAGGENVEPEPLETMLKTSTFIDQAVVVGQDEKTLGAILIPMVDTLEKEIPRAHWGENGGVLYGRDVQGLYRRELDALLSRGNGFRPTERIAKFRVVLEPMSVENGMLTQTLKVKRHKVNELHGQLIGDMFE